jgi:hypothetical protein
MKRCAILTFGAVLIFSSALLAAAISPSTEDQLKQLEQRAAKASDSAVGEYARDGLDAAKLSLAAAKTYAAAGREKETLQKVELAAAQLDAAGAKAAEKELIEKVALHRSEFKKLETQLERYRQGEVN